MYFCDVLTFKKRLLKFTYTENTLKDCMSDIYKICNFYITLRFFINKSNHLRNFIHSENKSYTKYFRNNYIQYIFSYFSDNLFLMQNMKSKFNTIYSVNIQHSFYNLGLNCEVSLVIIFSFTFNIFYTKRLLLG